MLGQMLNLPCSNLQKTMMVRVSWGERRILQARLKIYWERFGTGRTTDKETTVNTTGKVRLKAGKDTVQTALKERTHSTNVQVQGRKVKLYNTCFIWASILDWIYIYLWRSYTSGDSLGCFGSFSVPWSSSCSHGSQCFTRKRLSDRSFFPSSRSFHNAHCVYVSP